jgi:hypothetical protein
MIAAISSPDRPASFASWRYSAVSMTVCMIEYTAMPYMGQRQCSCNHIRLFDGFVFSALSKAHSGATTILVDEFHAGVLKGASYDFKGRATRLGSFLFELVDSHDADARAISQVLLAPAK